MNLSRLKALFFGFASLLVANAAAADIPQPGTQPIGRDGGIVTQIQPSTSCSSCHGNLDDSHADEPYDSWRGAMMANAARDPIFRAALAIAEVDNPSAGDFCIRCHSPPAWLGGRSSLPSWSAADGPRFAPDEDGFPSAHLDGVVCNVCHRADDTVASDSMAPHTRNARIYYLDGVEADIRLGPYTYEASGFMPSHGWAQSTFLASSRLCAQCHDIDNPVVPGRRPDGTLTGRDFAIERTYSEWAASSFATRGETCQSCHLELVPDRVAGRGGPTRSYFRRHSLVGGNVWVPVALASRVNDSSGEHQARLMATSNDARAMLRRAANLEIRDARGDGGGVHATVRVTNRTGHKLPTGYPEGRRMWLEVTVMGASGMMGASGVYDDATGTLRTDRQLRTYETKLGRGTTPSFHFILNDTILEDTRIPPEGFRSSDDMRPIGRDYSDGAGGTRSYDDAPYDFALCGSGTVTMRARLLYQSTTREYIEFLRDTAPADDLDPEVGNLGREAYDLWVAHGGREAIEMATTTSTITLAACAPADAGIVDSSVIDVTPGLTDAARDGTIDASADAGVFSGGGGCAVAPPSRDHRTLGLLAILAFGAVLRARRRRT